MPDPSPETPRTAYLPPRAAKARKLILRTQLGLAWLLAASLFALVILVAGTLLLLQGGRPGAPWVRVAAVAAVPEGSVAEVPAGEGRVVVVDRRGGLLQAFLAEAGPCPVTAAAGSAGFARSCQDEAWDADGTPRRAGAPALRRVPAQLARGDLYVDPTAPAGRPAGKAGRARASGGCGQLSHSTSRTPSSPVRASRNCSAS